MTLITSAVLTLLPILVSAQSVPYNSTSIGGYPFDHAVQYYRASHASNVTNTVSFTGFNWSVPVQTGNTNSSEMWQMHLNYSTVVVPSSSGNVTTGLAVASITFPEEEWPLDSDWQLATSFPLGPFPDSVASKSSNNSGSCIPYLGESCVTALANQFRFQGYIDYPKLPSPATIDECKGYANTFTSGIGSGVVSNSTSPDLVYNGSAYVNVTGSGQTYSLSNVTRQGLSSGEAFAGFVNVFPNNNIAASEATTSRNLYLIGLSIIPSKNYDLGDPAGGHAWTPEVRLVCMRANTTSGAMGLRDVPLGMMVLGMMIAGLMGLW